MGMSASQVRMLSLTSRLSDLEFSAQSVSNCKIRLADASAEASKNYQIALDKQKITVMNSDTSTYIDANAYNLTTYGAVSSMDKQRFLKDSAGRLVVNSATRTAYDNANGTLETFLTLMNCGTDSGKISYYTNVFNEIQDNGGGVNEQSDENMMDSEWLYEQLTAGNIFLSEWDSTAGKDGEGDFVEISWSSGDSSLVLKDDDVDMAKAEAEYQTVTAEIQVKDKKFDLQLKELDTEHTAIQTEIDSVKKVIDKNIERTFKVFNA